MKERLGLASGTQRKFFTTPLLSEARSDRNTEKFTKKKTRCQRGGVRGVANRNATTERTNQQTKRCSKHAAAALRKNHVVRPVDYEGCLPVIVARIQFTTSARMIEPSKHKQTKNEIIAPCDSNVRDFGTRRIPARAATVPTTGIHDGPLFVYSQTRRTAMQKLANV